MKKILVVDDSRSIHTYIDSILRGLGYDQIFHAYNGEEALKMYDDTYDLILMDWEMPIKTGPETLKIFKDNRIPTPIIIITSKSSLSDITFMLELGANDYIMKPFTPDILEEKISPFVSLKANVA